MNTLIAIVYFVYGLAFLIMGLALSLESGRKPALAETRLLRPLAVFGLVHGLHEWLEFFLIAATGSGAPTPAWAAPVRLILLVASFVALLSYGVQAFRSSPRPRAPRRRMAALGLILYVALILTSALSTYAGRSDIPWYPLLDALARYTLAVTGALTASHGLAVQARIEGQPAGVRPYLRMAALAFGIYGLSQLFVPQLEMFPANWLNGPAFLALTGFPHQIIRSLMAVVITWCLVRATQAVERQRQQDMLAAQQARLEALEQVQAELRQREALRHELLRHTVRAQEDERARIARELHDETAQMLSALSLDLATLKRMLPEETQTSPLVERLQSLGREMSQGLYRLVHDLRPAHLDELGLVPTLQVLIAEDFRNTLDVRLEVHGATRRLDPLVETVLFRLAQEGLTNIVRHADTNAAEMRLDYEDELVRLRIRDCGSGFDPRQDFHPPRGWGLAGMRDRVEALGGELQIRSAPGQGTEIIALIPLTRSAGNIEEA